ncbi:MAG: hypothetical protein R3F20_07210 [Planctomycetota bacterium]
MSEVAKIGDRMEVKVIARDEQDRIKLSRRAVLLGDDAEPAPRRDDRGDRGPRRDDRGDRGPRRDDQATVPSAVRAAMTAATAARVATTG